MTGRDRISRIVMTALLLGAGAAGLAGLGCAGREPARLQCMERFGQKTLVMGVWAWGDRFPKGVKYDGDVYLRELSEAGFNCFIGGERDLPYLEKYGLTIMYGACKARLPQLKEYHKKYGRHPAVIGYHLNDNCSLHGYTVECARWLEKADPSKIPWMSTNPNPVGQATVPMPVISSQVYPFSYAHTRSQEANRHAFANMCEGDRSHSNRNNMAVWTIIGCFAHSESPSQYRFQANTAVAYGAKGVWLFAWNRYFRAVLDRAATPANRYLTRVVGPRVLGSRSAIVFHSGPDLPGGHEKPGPGKLIEKMDEYLLAGVFVPDEQFRAGIDAPDYVMVVDKRTAKFSEQGKLGSWTGGHSDGELPRPKSFTDAVKKMYEVEDPKPRRAKITFGKRVSAVEALLPGGGVKKYAIGDSGVVELPPLRGGGAVLLRIDAQPLKPKAAPAGTVVWTLPNKWKFSLDPQYAGMKEKWFAAAFDDSKWKEIYTDRTGGWASQGYGRFRGDGWYRLRLAVPAEFRRRHLYLHFGAADEESWIHIDGKLAFEHSRRTTGLGFGELWTRPFHFDCTKFLTAGKKHSIAVKVFNNFGSGGIYRPIHLIGSDEPLDRDQVRRAVQKHQQKARKE